MSHTPAICFLVYELWVKNGSLVSNIYLQFLGGYLFILVINFIEMYFLNFLSRQKCRPLKNTCDFCSCIQDIFIDSVYKYIEHCSDSRTPTTILFKQVSSVLTSWGWPIRSASWSWTVSRKKGCYWPFQIHDEIDWGVCRTFQVWLSGSPWFELAGLSGLQKMEWKNCGRNSDPTARQAFCTLKNWQMDKFSRILGRQKTSNSRHV